MGDVAIVGATGMIGVALATSLARDGIPVRALVRNTARAAERLRTATLYAWDATRGAPPEEALAGCDAVVNLVGEPVASGRWTEARKKKLRDSRVVATRALVDALRGGASKPRVLVAASAVGYYGDRCDEILTEASSAGTGFLAELARDWEAEAVKAREFGVRVVLLRSGVVLSKAGGILHKLLTPFRMGLGGKIGPGTQWTPWIHWEDEIGLIRHAIASDAIEGPLNAVAPEPVTNAEFVRALGETLGRPTVMTAPSFALRWALGAVADEVLLAGQRAMPVRTLETGYGFKFPLLRPALVDLVGRKRPARNEALPPGEADPAP
jgi:uncharacterized protein